ncbi:hypothetical protein [Streptomyces sp. NBC_00316]|uniref:hypothetical protein n=1 Tax=Streptomyces sp. NBC_00316 TaxID=2975710 RepID=UPI002E2B1380|nr:hypothetical protein [Streptomyces sp. NBC_00316]
MPLERGTEVEILGLKDHSAHLHDNLNGELVLNVRADEHLRDRAATECERLAGVLGWRPSVSGVAKAYLKSIYRI